MSFDMANKIVAIVTHITKEARKMKFKIFTDASCDLTQQELQDYGVVSMPIGLTVGRLIYPKVDGGLPDPDEFYQLQKLYNNEAKTSGVSAATILSAFDKALKDEQDILYLGIDPDLSEASWNNMRKAKAMLQEKYPGRRIETPNTHSIAVGLGLIIDYMVNFCTAETTLDEALAELDRVKKRAAHWFTINEYKTLVAGGRVKKIPAILGTVANIKPFMRLPYRGSLEVVEKIQGSKKMLSRFASQVVTTIDPGSKIWLAYGAETQKERAEELRIMLMDELKSRTHDISFHRIGAIIGAHTGPSVFAAFFFASER